MVLLRFRVPATAADGTTIVNVAIGPNVYAAGTEFTLNDVQAKRWISKSDLEDGYIKFVGEIAGDRPKYTDTTIQDYLDGLTPEQGGTWSWAEDLDIVAVPVQVPALQFRVAAQTDVARVYPDFDCQFAGIEFTDLSKTMLAGLNYPVTVATVPNGTDTAVRLTEDPSTSGYVMGTREQLPSSVANYTSAGVWTNGTVAARSQRPTAAGCASGTVDLGLAASGSEWLYVGWYDRFDGVYFDVFTVNSAAATCGVEYYQITASGTGQWTNVTNLSDGTVSANKSWAQDGAMVWDRPGDWGSHVAASGYGEWYYVRVRSSAAATAGAAACNVRVVSRKIRGYDNDLMIKAGDAVRFDTGLDTTLGATQAATGATMVNLTLWLARVR